MRGVIPFVVVVVMALGSAIGAPAASAAEPGVGEMGPNSLPGGPLNYVALGDSFSSGEGAPFVDRAQVPGYEAMARYRRCVMLAPGRPQQDCAATPIDPDQVENDLGWLGDTGTDVTALNGGERRLASLSDSSSFGGNNCHRSAHAYPARVWWELDQQDPGWGVTFAACSGAVVGDFSDVFRGEGGQSGAFGNGPADLVTLGFGGNDVGFGSVVTCMLVEAGVDRGLTVSGYLSSLRLRQTSPAVAADAATEVDGCREYFDLTLEDRLAGLGTDLDTMYGRVRDLAPDARVMAVGYPRLFPADPPDSCSLGSGASVGRDNMVWLNDFADRLDAVIRASAARHGLSYIDTSDIIAVPGADGVRHDFCIDDGGDRWINRYIPSDLRRSMHPKFHYHEEVAARVLRCWGDETACRA